MQLRHIQQADRHTYHDVRAEKLYLHTCNAGIFVCSLLQTTMMHFQALLMHFIIQMSTTNTVVTREYDPCVAIQQLLVAGVPI